MRRPRKAPWRFCWERWLCASRCCFSRKRRSRSEILAPTSPGIIIARDAPAPLTACFACIRCHFGAQSACSAHILPPGRKLRAPDDPDGPNARGSHTPNPLPPYSACVCSMRRCGPAGLNPEPAWAAPYKCVRGAGMVRGGK